MRGSFPLDDDFNKNNNRNYTINKRQKMKD